MTESAHASAMDAVGFWRQFVTPFYFENPGDWIAGRLIDYGSIGPVNDPTPVLTIQTKTGDRYSVTASQERLKALLKAACPARGDGIKITYTREADKAAPGMNKAKLFDVEVRRRTDLPPPPAAAATGGGSSTNGQGVVA